MMRLCSVFAVTVAFGAAFLILQVIVYRDFLFKVYDGTKFSSMNQQRSSGIDWEKLNQVLQIFEKLKMKIILIDNQALHLWQKLIDRVSIGMKSNKRCLVLCSRKVSYALLDKDWDANSIKVYNQLSKQNIPYVVDYGDDPRIIHWSLIGDRIVYHLWIRPNNDIWIQITILYKRGNGKYLWYGPVKSPSALSTFSRNISIDQFGDFEGIYDTFTTIEVDVDGFRVNIPTNINSFVRQVASQYVACNMSRAMAFFKNHRKDLSPKAKEFRSIAENLLTKAKKVLDGLMIPFWISSGTCLGWFRQCDVIPYSNDVDIGIMADDYKTDLIDAMKRSGFSLKFIFGKPNDSYELSFMYQQIKLDIFFFYKEKSYYWNGGTQAKTGLKFKYIFPKFTLCWTEFLNLKIRVPCNTQVYIEANYGIDWFTPVKTWDWKESPPNVIKNGQWDRQEWSKVIQTHN